MSRKENLPQKQCLICGRPMVWRKKWSKVWDDVKYCSERCRRQRNATTKRADERRAAASCSKLKETMREFTTSETDRIIQMAWEDRTTFDAIRDQFGLEPGQVIKLMRKNLKASSFRLWRKRTAGRDTKHLSKRSFKVGRFRCKSQRG